MLNIDEIDSTIIELENGATTFDTCMKLAALYAVREHFDSSSTEDMTVEEDTVVSEYQDILPEYRKYIEIKRDYQLGSIDERAVETQIQKVCKEIDEFLHTLYSCTDMPTERDCIKEMLKGLQNL